MEGIERLQAYLQEKMKAAEPEVIRRAQAAGAEVMLSATRSLTRPRRTGKMLESFAYEYDPMKQETIFGWGKFYGRLKESGHAVGGFARKRTPKRTQVKSQAHLRPTFEANRERILSAMADTIQGG